VTFGGIVLTGDATDLNVLNEARMGDAAAVIAVTNSDNTNIMVAQMAKELYRVEHVIARLYDPAREGVYREFGIQTISPVLLSTKLIHDFLYKQKGDARK
ncbi:MAG: NAD-binding protein, partial [Oscillospiraceae bacterium]|nr:NAD-binding protein [Oscillospiraceae bacterium]